MTDPLFEEFRNYIREQAGDVCAAYDRLLSTPRFRLLRTQHKRCIAFTHNGSPRGGYYAFIVNRDSLLFYIRKPAWCDQWTDQRNALQERFKEYFRENPAGEWTVKIRSVEEVRFLEALSANTPYPLRPPERATATTTGTPASDRRVRQRAMNNGGLPELALAEYWSKQRVIDGRWMHPEDECELSRQQHPFNLDHPISPFVGDLRAEVVILGANGGYSEEDTPRSFAGQGDIADFLEQVASGTNVGWVRRQEPYYHNKTYSNELAAGRAVVINACAYRSRNRPSLHRIRRLPSVKFIKDWLRQVIAPQVHRRERLIVGWRPGLWKDALDALGQAGVVRDGNPRLPDLSWTQWTAVARRLRRS